MPGIPDPANKDYISFESKNYPGRFGRTMPAGYEQTIRENRNLIEHPSLHRFYDKLSPVIKGNIFDFVRFVKIIKMNLGFYDKLLKDYTPPEGK